jgi:hypothetical protein
MFLSFAARRNCIGVSGALAVAAMLVTGMTAEAQQSAVQCKPAATLQRVPELPEGSGLAASRRTPGRFSSHNDSGEPVLFALDGNGRVTGRLSISGATVEDWEAVAVGPCPSGSCIFVADIGDSDGERKQITVYRIVEPADASGSAKVDATLHATYPDGSHDAEALLVTPEGRLLIVTKGDTGRKAALAPTGIDADATGEAEIEFRKSAPAEQEVEFSVGNVAPGTVLTFVIDGTAMATATADSRGRAEVELDVRMPGATALR